MNASRHQVLYDSDCPMCTFQMRLLSWLDWFGRLEMLAIQDPRAKAIAPRLTRDDLMEAIHCVTPEGRIYRGARCLRFVGMRLPLFVPLAVFLWLPGVIWVAEKIYACISRHRYTLSRLFGCKGACAILPERKKP